MVGLLINTWFLSLKSCLVIINSVRQNNCFQCNGGLVTMETNLPGENAETKTVKGMIRPGGLGERLSG